MKAQSMKMVAGESIARGFGDSRVVVGLEMLVCV